MRRHASTIIRYSFLLGLGLTLCQPRANAQSTIVVPAGTLLHCTLGETNFSSATAAVGDPVLCHLSSFQQFGRTVFPRGSYLQGHLEADKDPGHFIGKGYLRLVFDRIGLPDTDVPVPTKVVSARGYRVDREGDIVGHGHATRDTVEWLFPPLWPWKVISLPAKGPRPALKGEEPITVRLMEDILVPRPTQAFGFNSFDQRARRSSENLPQADRPRNWEQVDVAELYIGHGRVTLVALNRGGVYPVISFRVEMDSGRLDYVLEDGKTGALTLAEVDWARTSLLNAARNAALEAGWRVPSRFQ